MATREYVNPSTLLAPPGPYSQVVRAGDLVFVSGQVGADSDNQLIGPGIAEQCDQALRNVRSALEAVGLGLEHVVKLTLFVVYPEDLPELAPHMDRSFPEFFGNGYPASSLVIVQRLFAPELRIEIEAIAHV